MAGTPQPVAGYASKTEAIKALHALGMTPFMIAQQIGSTADAVSERLRQLRRAAGDSSQKRPTPKPKASKPQAEPDNRGIWTPEKIEKAHRLFGKTMLLIAEALQVPPKELIAYGLKGVIPPMGKPQRVAQLLEQKLENARTDEAGAPAGRDGHHGDIDRTYLLAAPSPEPGAADADAGASQDAAKEEETAAETEPAAAPPHAAAVEPAREDDEAELAELEEQESDDDDTGPLLGKVQASSSGGNAAGEPTAERGTGPQEAGGQTGEEGAPSPPRRYRLTNGAGDYLDKSGVGMTRTLAKAWDGTAQQMEGVFRVKPHLKDLDPEPVHG